MGQKVHPFGMRLGFIKDWRSVWYSDTKGYADKLNTDLQVRSYLYKKLQNASVGCIKIERPSRNARVTIFTARPGVIIGKKGEYVEKLRNILVKMMGIPIQIDIKEIQKPELNAQLVAKNIVQQLEKRMMFRRVMKRAMQTTLKMGAKGVKIAVKGRLNGAEIARKECFKEGRVPLHTFRADIDYSCLKALTTYGILGVKVWIFKGEVLPSSKPAMRSSSVAGDNKKFIKE